MKESVEVKSNGNGSWKDWTNYVLFAITMTLATGITVGYISYDGRNRDLQFKLVTQSIDTLAKTMEKTDQVQLALIDKIVAKQDELCNRMTKTEERLKLDYPSRMKLYRLDKFDDPFKHFDHQKKVIQ